MNESAKPRLLLRLCAIFGLLVAACSGAPEEPPLKGARIGGPFSLVDQSGRPVTERSFAGRYTIVYFGFTHCPDVCPTDLAAIGRGLTEFERKDPARAAKVQPLFISVDPERDTPAVVGQYAAAFHPRLLGLTGTPEQVAAVAKAYAVYFHKEPPQPGGGYGVDHARVAILMDPGGAPVALLPQDKGAEGIAAALDRWVR